MRSKIVPKGNIFIVYFPKELIFRIANDRSLTIKCRGYSSCGEMLRKGAKQLQLFNDLGCKRFVICYDADRDNPVERKQSIIDNIVKPAGFDAIFCALVPIQEIETWILADIMAVTNIIKGWAPTKEIIDPENIQDPKEHLEKMSRERQRPRYSHAIHNPQIAKYLNLELVAKRCPSFRPLVTVVQTGKGNI